MVTYPCKGDREFDFMTIGEKNVVLEEMLEKAEKGLAQKEARIAQLEEALRKIIQTYPIDALGLTVDARMREIAREALKEMEDE